MKKSIILSVILTFCITSLFGQDFKPWNVSLNFSTSFSGVLIAPAVNLEIGNKTEISLMPVYRYYKGSSTYTNINYGLQFSGKYYLSKENKMDPYISVLTGYLKEKSIREGNEPDYYDYFIFGVLLGNEINLGQRGWSFDFNVGLINSQPLSYSSSLNVFPAYSIGIKKRFIKK
jgi:hypothetical protein